MIQQVKPILEQSLGMTQNELPADCNEFPTDINIICAKRDRFSTSAN